ncbi:MAG: hypothetical protein DBY08_05635 [Clostridiales bacterium]|nr:hypothetical protein [Bacillota bacterium]MEE0517882.1 flavodoxin domain-containing protein [Anaerovoracaceae bacterium]PWL93187.1 MAG: hypothetical protein DBY08_05635 [Clostridiales bacterium]
MEKTVVIYKSKHGSTKKYAEWIGEELCCPVIAEADFSKKDFDNYENVIFGGCVQAGGIMGFDIIKKNMRRLQGKKLVVFAVGLNVMQKETRMQLREINFGKRKLAGITCYYCPGAYSPENIHGIDAGIMKMMVNMLKSKKPIETTDEDRVLLEHVQNGVDMTDRKYIEPIVAEFK